MGKIIFITGPARSGKSKFAVELAKKYKKVIFIATSKPKDKEMEKRIEKHKLTRPKHWITIEEEIDIERIIKKFSPDTFIVDCITIWISNLLIKGLKEEEIMSKLDIFIYEIKNNKSLAIIVSNEVGWGIVPKNKLARKFRDIIGNIHQIICKNSQEVYLMVSGIPIKLERKNE